MKKESGKRMVTIHLPEGLYRALKRKAGEDVTFMSTLIDKALRAHYNLKEVDDEK